MGQTAKRTRLPQNASPPCPTGEEETKQRYREAEELAQAIRGQISRAECQIRGCHEREDAPQA